MVIAEKLRQMRDNSGMTVQEISSASGVPVSTLNKIFCGQTSDPQFSTIAAIVKVMHGSLDDLVGITHKSEQTNAMTALHKELQGKERWLLRMFVFCCVLIGVILIAVMWDIFTADGGYIRY